MINFKGKLTIGRIQNGDVADPIRISIEDATSGVHILTLNVGLENFAECLTGLSFIPCSGEINLDAPINMVREVKKELVPVPDNTHNLTKEQLRQLLDSFEVDGWKGYLDDLTNHHRTTYEIPVAGKKKKTTFEMDKRQRYQSVTFIRFVENKELNNESETKN